VIALLFKSEQILSFRAKNLAAMLLLLTFGVNFEFFDATNDSYGSDRCMVISQTPESSDFPLSAPFSTDKESSGIEDDFLQDHETFIKLSITAVYQPKSVWFHYQKNFLPQEFLTRPFTPPEPGTHNRA
jgi:hypothetical protein